jgi:hypothetical protein
MKLNQLEARLPAMYYSALEDGGPSYLITSDPGRGKTSIFRRFKKIMKRVDPAGKWGFALINGANFTLMTGMGFMIPSKDAKGQDVAKFTLPYWYQDYDTGEPLDEFSGGILLIDEYDKLGLDEKKIVGEAALSKMLGNRKLPPGWVVMFAGNRLTNRSGSTRDLDHMIMRRISLEVTDDVECTVEYFRSINVLPEVIQFAEENPQLLFEPQPEDQRPRCSPRTLHQVDIHLRSLMSAFDTNEIPTDPLTIEEINGGIGKPACAQLVKTIRLGQELKPYEEYISNPKTVTLPSKPDAQRLLSYKIAARVTPKDAAQALAFMARMPEEHQVMFVRMAVQRNYQLAFEPHFAEWCAKKTALIAVLNRYKVEDK